jgi:hypothetical protein
MCIRDEEGCYVLSKILWITPLCSVEVGKALGLYHIIMWINELQLANVYVEVDLKKVADYYARSKGDFTEFGVIMYACIHLYQTSLTNSSFEFIMRQGRSCFSKDSHISR